MNANRARPKEMFRATACSTQGIRGLCTVPSNGGRLTRLYTKVFMNAFGEDQAQLLGQICAGGTYGIIAVSAAGTLGIDTSPLIAGFGGLGVSIGFAVKDTVGNILAGLSLVVQKPFKTGDVVTIVDGKYTGRILAIDYRYVLVELSKSRVFIPTSLIYAAPIEVQKQ